jgi:general secretion pathway protein F
MPEACEVIAIQAEQSHRFRRAFWLMSFLIGGMMATVPVALLFVRGAVEAFRNLDKGGDSLPGLLREVARQFIWPVGPISLIAIIALFAFSRLWHSMRARDLRHKFVLRLPTIGKRARAESVRYFTWALGRLTRVGIAPKTALLAASEAMPNLELRSRIEASGLAMSDSERISSAVQMLNFLPPEAAPMLSTGEMTGDLPTQLGYLERAAHGDFENESDQAKRRIGCWVILIFALGMVFLAYLIYGVFYGSIFDITNSWQDDLP